DFFVTQAFERRFDLSLFAFVANIVNTFHGFKEVPDGINCALNRLIAIGKRNYAHQLWKVGVGSGPNQQTARLATLFLRPGAQPWPCSVTHAERPVLQERSLG